MTHAYSLVVPVYNEAASLPTLHEEISEVAKQHGYQLDIVFVDDGSTDDSWATIERLAAADTRVQGLRFRRNFGKAAALSAGFQAARGEVVFTLDADLQDDPREIPAFLATMAQGYDVVSGWKQVRHDPWHKVGPSRVFNALVGWLTGVRLHDHNCGFKCYRREIFQEVRLYGELHRFVPVLAAAKGWKVGEVVVRHRARKYGYSKYGFRRFVKGFLDLLTVYFLTGFGRRPQHLLGTLGLLSFATGSVGLAVLALTWIVNQIYALGWTPLHQRPLVLYCLGLLLMGAQFLTAGFLAELIAAQTARTEDPYSIAARVGTQANRSAASPSGLGGAGS